MKPAELLEAAYRRFLQGNPGDLFALLADDVAYHLPGLHLGGGTLRGRSSLFERLASAANECSAPPQVELLNVVSAGDFVVTVERFQAVASSGVLDQQACVVWRFVAGRCAEIWSHFEDQPACDEFWRAAAG